MRTTYVEGWKNYPFSAAGHHLQGTAAMVGIMEGSDRFLVLGVVWTALYLAYQGLSVLRKKDSPGLDVCDYMVGAGAGIIGTVLAGSLGIV